MRFFGCFCFKHVSLNRGKKYLIRTNCCYSVRLVHTIVLHNCGFSWTERAIQLDHGLFIHGFNWLYYNGKHRKTLGLRNLAIVQVCAILV